MFSQMAAVRSVHIFFYIRGESLSVNFLVKQCVKTAELEIIFLSVIVLKAVLALNFSGCPFLWLSNQP